MLAENVQVTFSRPAEADHELWNTESQRDLHFDAMAPGEAYMSMFCMPARWEDSEPVTVTVCYKNGRLFRRMTDIDATERWWWRVLGDLVPRMRVQHRKSFVLNPTQFFAFRTNIGYAGKRELEEIASELKRIRQIRERQERNVFQTGLPFPTWSDPAEPEE